MERITREALNIQIASLIAKRGTCKRLQVGAVITRDNRIVATGYNGPARNQEHCNDFMCNTDTPCRRAIHAEANAIVSLKGSSTVYNGIFYQGEYILYCTHNPCLGCAITILEDTPIKKVYYLNLFRSVDGIQLLKLNGIQVIKINEEGISQD